jgi:uncharacterized membrane protein YoaK (UPF0700 family)
VADRSPVPEARAGVALALAFVAGGVDVIGWLALDRLYTSHVTGNTASVGIELSKGHAGAAFTRAVPVIAFGLGALGGGVLAEVLLRRGVRSTVAPGLAITAALLGGFLLWGSHTAHAGVVPLEPWWAFDLQAALLSGAMGVQTATFRRVDGATVRTTYLTGMISTAAEEIADRLVTGKSDERFARRIAVVLGIWPGFLAGAIAGAFGHARWSVGALLLPLAVLIAVAGIDVVWPVGGPAGSVDERRAQRRGPGE